jgi:hypothetical protein
VPAARAEERAAKATSANELWALHAPFHEESACLHGFSPDRRVSDWNIGYRNGGV